MLCAYHAMWAMGKTYAMLEVRTVLPLMCTVDRRLTLLRCRCCLLYAVNVHESLSVALAADHCHARQSGSQTRHSHEAHKTQVPRSGSRSAGSARAPASVSCSVQLSSTWPGSILVHLSDSSCGRTSSGKTATSSSVSYRQAKCPHTRDSQLAPFR